MKLKVLIPTIIFSVLILCRISTIITLCSATLIIAYDIFWWAIDLIKKNDGNLYIVETPEKITWKFELSKDPEAIRKKNTVTFGVKDSSS